MLLLFFRNSSRSVCVVVGDPLRFSNGGVFGQRRSRSEFGHRIACHVSWIFVRFHRRFGWHWLGFGIRPSRSGRRLLLWEKACTSHRDCRLRIGYRYFCTGAFHHLATHLLWMAWNSSYPCKHFPFFPFRNYLLKTTKNCILSSSSCTFTSMGVNH